MILLLRVTSSTIPPSYHAETFVAHAAEMLLRADTAESMKTRCWLYCRHGDAAAYATYEGAIARAQR